MSGRVDSKFCDQHFFVASFPRAAAAAASSSSSLIGCRLHSRSCAHSVPRSSSTLGPRHRRGLAACRRALASWVSRASLLPPSPPPTAAAAVAAPPPSSPSSPHRQTSAAHRFAGARAQARQPSSRRAFVSRSARASDRRDALA